MPSALRQLGLEDPNIFQMTRSSSAAAVGAGEMQEDLPNSWWQTVLQAEL